MFLNNHVLYLQSIKIEFMYKLSIALVEPFYTGSHKKWTDEFKLYSSHNIKIYSLSGRFWKWRMHGGAISLAKQILESNTDYDLFLVSDFLDLGLFKSIICDSFPNSKYVIYFHENQLTYPWSPTDNDTKLKRDVHYSFINYTSSLVADKVLFNSKYHLNSFINNLPQFLKKFPDENNLWTIEKIKDKSSVLNLALEFPKLDKSIKKIEQTILWNHRWEYDKNPKEFFKVLKKIKQQNTAFKLIVLGEKTEKHPKIFNWAKDYFQDEILHFGYVASKQEYWNWLQKASILMVTSNQDFFGISIVEAMHAKVFPLLPNRLAYPQHIPLQFQNKHLYSSTIELEEMLIELLKKGIEKTDFKIWVSKYSWKNSIAEYDKALCF